MDPKYSQYLLYDAKKNLTKALIILYIYKLIEKLLIIICLCKRN